jgi:2-iminobutanoate/2-iminopropanoate deaminase
MSLTQIATEKAPAALGPYSQAISANGFVYASGQLGLVPQTGELAEGGIEAQAAQALDNLSAVLEAAGSSLDNVVKTTCFMADLSQFGTFNDIYAKYFTTNPARECVQVVALPKGALIEVSAIAVA